MKSFLKYTRLLFGCFSIFIISLSSHAQTLSIQTKFFSIHFESEVEPLAQHIALNADNIYLDVLEKINAPDITHFHILLINEPGYFNASAQIFMEPTIRLHTYPFVQSELLDNDDMWLSTLKHELSHAMSARMGDNLISFLYQFGYLLTPNSFMPRGFQEGIAQVIESNDHLKSGRAFSNSSYYEQRWIDQYHQGFLSYQDFAQINSSIDAHNAYLYGAYFFSYLQKKYGNNVINQWLELRSHSLTLDIINTNLSWEKVFGISLIQTWDNFLIDERNRIEKIIETQIFDYQLINLGKNTSFAGYRQELNYDVLKHTDKWLIAVKSKGAHSPSYVGIYQTDNFQEEATLIRKLPISTQQIKFLDSNRIVYSHFQNCNQTQQLSLSIINIKTKKQTRLSNCEKGFMFDIQGDQIIWLHAKESNSQFTSFNTNTYQKTLILDFQFPSQISDFALTPDQSSLVIQLKEDFNSKFNLYHFNLKSGEKKQLTFDGKIRRYLKFMNNTELLFTQDILHNLKPQIYSLENNKTYTLSTDKDKNIESALNPISIDNSLFFLNLRNNHLKLYMTNFEKSNESNLETNIELNNSENNHSIPKSDNNQYFKSTKYKAIDSFKVTALIPSAYSDFDTSNTIALNIIANDAKQDHFSFLTLEQNLTTNLINLSFDYDYKKTFSWKSILNFDQKFTSGYQLNYLKDFNYSNWSINNNLQFSQFHYENKQSRIGFRSSFNKAKFCTFHIYACKGFTASFSMENINGFTSLPTYTNAHSSVHIFNSMGKNNRLVSSLNIIYSDHQTFLDSQTSLSVISTLTPSSLNLKGYNQLNSSNYSVLVQNRFSHNMIISKNWDTYAIGVDSLQANLVYQLGNNESNIFKNSLGFEFNTRWAFFWLGNIDFKYSIFKGLNEDSKWQQSIGLGVN